MLQKLRQENHSNFYIIDRKWMEKVNISREHRKDAFSKKDTLLKHGRTMAADQAIVKH